MIDEEVRRCKAIRTKFLADVEALKHDERLYVSKDITIRCTDFGNKLRWYSINKGDLTVVFDNLAPVDSQVEPLSLYVRDAYVGLLDITELFKNEVD